MDGISPIGGPAAQPFGPGTDVQRLRGDLENATINLLDGLRAINDDPSLADDSAHLGKVADTVMQLNPLVNDAVKL